MTTISSVESSKILSEISNLEQRLREAKSQLHALHTTSPDDPVDLPIPSSKLPLHLHALLLLSDSALPLGSFAFSNGLESFLAHRPSSKSPLAQFTHFLGLSLDSLVSSTLPYLIAGYLHPGTLEELDNDLDASTPCTVARRASTKQGLALLGVWEKSFKNQLFIHDTTKQPDLPVELVKDNIVCLEAYEALKNFSLIIKSPQQDPIFHPNGHLPPLLGTLCAALALPLDQTLYLYLFNHAKTIISAAIRAGVLGPYQAQGVLAGRLLKDKISGIVAREVGTRYRPGVDDVALNAEKQLGSRSTREAGQSVPMLDLWGGRHEIIYSRIFNS